MKRDVNTVVVAQSQTRKQSAGWVAGNVREEQCGTVGGRTHCMCERSNVEQLVEGHTVCATLLKCCLCCSVPGNLPRGRCTGRDGDV